MNLIGNFNIYEIIWTAVATLAAYVAWKNYRAAKQSLRLTQKNDHNLWITQIEERIAKGHVRRESSRVFVNALWALIGLQGGLFIPTPLANPLAGILLIFTSLVFLYNSLRDKEDREIIEASVN